MSYETATFIYFCQKFHIQILNKAITILFLACLIGKPIFDIGYLTYFELNLDYIIQTYCVNKDKPQLHCNGKCHLAKTLSMNKKQEKERHYNFIETFYPLYFQDYTYTSPIPLYALKAQTIWCYLLHLFSQYITLPKPPPKMEAYYFIP